MTKMQRLCLFITAPLFLFSCQERKGTMAASARNYEPLAWDTACIAPWSDAFFELHNQNFESISFALQKKLKSILGDEVFDEKAFGVLKDSLKNAVFSLQYAIDSGNFIMDTTNLLLLKDPSGYYVSDTIRPATLDWRKLLTQHDLFTYQTSGKSEIGYTIQPCIKKLFKQVSTIKRERKREALPEYSKNSNGFVDKLNVYSCLFYLLIHIDISDKSGIFSPRKQFYIVSLIDTAKVYSSQDLLKTN
jgi:hypothetical protein